MLVEVGERVVALDIGIDRWETPAFAQARAQTEKARSKKGPYGRDANVKVTIPAIGKAAEVVYSVTKNDDGDLVFKSDYDAKTTGLDAFARKFRTEAYAELDMIVQSADSTSCVALPEESGFSCEGIELRDTEEDTKWRRWKEEEAEEAEEEAEEAEEEAEAEAQAAEDDDEAVAAENELKCSKCGKSYKYAARLASHEAKCGALLGSRLARKTDQPPLSTHSSHAKRGLEASAVIKAATSIDTTDELEKKAAALLAEQSSVLSEQRNRFYRQKRDELDGAMVDLEDEEAQVANMREASRLAKLEYPDDPRLAALRAALERKRELQTELAQTTVEMENILSKFGESSSKKQRTK
jgi:hypothetical protein